VTAKAGAFYNPDLELPGTPGSIPTNWSFGSSPAGNTTFTASTNLYYGRITRTVNSGSV
jgi:hypothetical protein